MDSQKLRVAEGSARWGRNPYGPLETAPSTGMQTFAGLKSGKTLDLASIRFNKYHPFALIRWH